MINKKNEFKICETLSRPRLLYDSKAQAVRRTDVRNYELKCVS
jgi:hypothetical protein